MRTPLADSATRMAASMIRPPTLPGSLQPFGEGHHRNARHVMPARGSERKEPDDVPAAQIAFGACPTARRDQYGRRSAHSGCRVNRIRRREQNLHCGEDLQRPPRDDAANANLRYQSVDPEGPARGTSHYTNIVFYNSSGVPVPPTSATYLSSPMTLSNLPPAST
jgi:hypothetical protein